MTDENFTGPHRNTNQTKESISEILKSRRYGVNLDPDKIDDFAPNHVAQRIVANKAIREQVSLGADMYGEIKTHTMNFIMVCTMGHLLQIGKKEITHIKYYINI